MFVASRGLSVRFVLCFVYAFVAFAFIGVERAHALGISPSTVTAQSVLKNTSQTKKIFISRSPSDPKGEILVNVKADGEHARYLKLNETLLIPKGEDGAHYLFEIAPQDAPNGDYSVGIIFSIAPPPLEKSSGSAVAVVAGVKARVKFTVDGRQVVEYSVANFSVADTETGRSTTLSYTVTNTGNVDARPEGIEGKFVDTEDDTHTVGFAVSKDLPTVKPGKESERVAIELDTTLEEGQYRAAAKFIGTKPVDTELTSQPFRVFPPGTLKQSGELVSLQSNKSEYEAGEKVKIQGVFRNTGDLPIDAVLVTQVMTADSKILDVVRSTEVNIARRSEAPLASFIDLDAPGAYTLVSSVKYGNKETPEKQVEVKVVPSGMNLPWIIVLIVLVIVVAIGIGVLAFRRRGRRS